MRRSLAGRYCDLDMVVGNLPLFVSRAELEQHDIVTYSFGDQEALYLRGQWTVHRNEPRVSSVWQRCEHLAGQLQKELGSKKYKGKRDDENSDDEVSEKLLREMHWQQWRRSMELRSED